MQEEKQHNKLWGTEFWLGGHLRLPHILEWSRVWIFWLSLMGCSLISLSLSPPNASQTAPGWSSLRSCCCSRLLSISSCHLASSALPAARILCWRVPLPIAPPRGMRGRTCGGKGSQSPPARLPTWVSDGFCSPLGREVAQFSSCQYIAAKPEKADSLPASP